MPEYTLAGIAWLAAGFGLAAAAGILRQRRTWIAFGAFLGFTVVFDALLTGLPIVTYGAEHVTGIRLGTTPVEDYLYGQALCLTAIASHELARRRLGRAAPVGPAGGSAGGDAGPGAITGPAGGSATGAGAPPLDTAGNGR
jgi:lycopene cyclase domain-containing protein